MYVGACMCSAPAGCGMRECLCRYTVQAMVQAENVLRSTVESKLHGAVAFNKRLICSWPGFSWEIFQAKALLKCEYCWVYVST